MDTPVLVAVIVAGVLGFLVVVGLFAWCVAYVIEYFMRSAKKEGNRGRR